MNVLLSSWKYLAIGIAATSFLIGDEVSAQNQLTETQSFDSDASAAAAGWVANEESQNPGRNIDLGWKNSGTASGESGEAGGLMHRSGTLPVAYYADTTIGTLTFEDALEARGQIHIINTDMDGEIHLGFFDPQHLEDDPENMEGMGQLGLLIAEPGGGIEPNFRWGHVFAANGSLVAGQCPQPGDPLIEDSLCQQENNVKGDGLRTEETVDFSLVYDPASATVAFTLGEDGAEFDIPESILMEGATFTGFGIYSGNHITSFDDRSAEIYIDNVTYSSKADPLARLDDGSLTDPQARIDYVHDVLGTWIGDSNNDGEFNSGDLVEVFQAGEYEDDIAGNSVWATGDWNGDTEFNSGDLVSAFQDGGFEAGRRPDLAAVPEPSLLVLIAIGILCIGIRDRRNGGSYRPPIS